jgi:purine-binding chemotaxis protein CheW
MIQHTTTPIPGPRLPGDDESPKKLQQRISAAYRERAAQLAQPRNSPTTHVHDGQLLVVTACGQNFGLLMQHVVHLSKLTPLTSIPGAPPELLGVTTLQEEIQSVYALGRLFSLPDSRLPTWTRLVQISAAGRTLALAVDELGEFSAFDRQALQAASQVIAPEAASMVLGWTGDNVLVVQLENLLQHPAVSGRHLHDNRRLDPQPL